MKKYISAIILAAGIGKRFNDKIPKQFSLVNSKSVLCICLEEFTKSELIDEIILVYPKDFEEKIKEEVGKCDNRGKTIKLIKGGDTRQKSAIFGVDSVDEKSDFVLIHDVARCLITSDTIDNFVKKAMTHDSCILANKIVDTLKICKNMSIESSIDRTDVWAAETPQMFKTNIYRACSYMALKDKFCATDDASIVEHYGFNVSIIESLHLNIKLTTEKDLKLISYILAKGN